MCFPQCTQLAKQSSLWRLPEKEDDWPAIKSLINTIMKNPTHSSGVCLVKSLHIVYFHEAMLIFKLEFLTLWPVIFAIYDGTHLFPQEE